MTGLITSALLFIGPAYFANAAATLDGGRRLADGQPIFGSHKTVRGVIAGIVVGTLIGLGESFVDSRLVVAGFMIALGAVLGDLLGAFVKRRLKVEPGRSFPILWTSSTSSSEAFFSDILSFKLDSSQSY